jgi:hypothetical protein
MHTRMAKKESLTRVAIRVPEKLRKALAERAEAFNRSLNYEIIVRLKASIDLDKLLDSESTNEALEMLEKMKVRHRQLRLPAEVD